MADEPTRLAQFVIDELNELAAKKGDRIGPDDRAVFVFRDHSDGFGEVLSPKKKKRLGRSKLALKERRFIKKTKLIRTADDYCDEQLLDGVDRNIALATLVATLESGLSTWAVVARGVEELIAIIDKCERRGDNSWSAGSRDGVNGFYTVHLFWNPESYSYT